MGIQFRCLAIPWEAWVLNSSRYPLRQKYHLVSELIELKNCCLKLSCFSVISFMLLVTEKTKAPSMLMHEPYEPLTQFWSM